MQPREHYKDIGYKPFLFFAVFGVSGEDVHPSRSRHHVDCLPESLEIHALRRPEHSAYLDGFFGGAPGKVLRESAPELYEACRAAENCIVIKGQIEEDSQLDYMRNVIGIIQSLLDEGAVGVLDASTFRLISPQDWKDRFFEKEVNAQNHAVILFSEEEDGYWLHTRGMAQFGRPDCSLHGVEQARIDEFCELINQMIFYGGQGVFFDGSFRLHTRSGNAYVIESKFVEDFDNDDFNNAYCEIRIAQEG